jgi:hypothetical protein
VLSGLESPPRETVPVTETRSSQIEEADRLLSERGRQFGRARVALGRSGIAIGFPKDPLLHVSWWVLSAFSLVSIWFWRRHSRDR